jgi:hypothetical protein
MLAQRRRAWWLASSAARRRIAERAAAALWATRVACRRHGSEHEQCDDRNRDDVRVTAAVPLVPFVTL